MKIICSDAYELDAEIYKAGDNQNPIILLNGATAVRKEFYAGFAKYLQENGFTCITYDYRGIGKSKPKGGLKNMTTKYLDWATLDMTAALKFTKDKFPDKKILILGHSVGGQMAGLIQNLELADALLGFGCSSGYWGNMKFMDRLKSHYFFKIIRPISHLLFGFTAAKKLGIMEDLPSNVSNDWRKWCSVPQYFFDKKYIDEILPYSKYSDMGIPVKMIHATDDYIGTPKNIEGFWSNVKSSKGLVLEKWHPADFGLKEIGHFGPFQKKFQNTLWPMTLAEIKKMPYLFG